MNSSFRLTTDTAAISREMIFNGAVIGITIPENATKGSVPGLEIPYLHFTRPVKGGPIHLHAREELVDMCGKKVVARCEVWCKITNGQNRLYIDLVPAEQDAIITHKLCIIQMFDLNMQESGRFQYSFPTPHPLTGLIGFEAVRRA